jgi:hypothetical protein
MRRLVQRSKADEAPVEDVEVQYFDFDDKGNVQIRRAMVEVPLGCGRFAQAAMLKGFFEYFNKPLIQGGLTVDQASTIESIETTLAGWNRIASQAQKPANDSQPELAPQ